MEASSHPQLQYNTEKVAEAKTDHNIDRLDYLPFSDSESANHFVCSSYHRVGETLTGKMCVLTQQDSEIRFTQLSDEFKFGIFSQSVHQIAPNSCSVKVGCSDAHFRVFTLSNSDDGVTLNQDKDLQIKESGDMILNHHESEFGEYAFAMDSGDLIVYDVETDQEKFSQPQAHEYQAWTVFCDPYQQNIVYTGADDTKFKGWDLRVSGVPTFTSKEHEYGVTCIRDWLGDSHYLVTGSYDQKLRLWDKRALKAPTETLDIGMQIWDIKYHQDSENKFTHVGVSCVWDGMYFAEVPSSESLCTLSSLKSFNYPKVEVLYYAFDFCPCDSESQKVVNVAFYDNNVELVELQ